MWFFLHYFKRMNTFQFIFLRSPRDVMIKILEKSKTAISFDQKGTDVYSPSLYSASQKKKETSVIRKIS